MRCLAFMNAEYREGRPQAAPQQNTDDKFSGEYMEWQIADAVRAEHEDGEVELRLVRGSVQYVVLSHETSDDDSEAAGCVVVGEATGHLEELFMMTENTNDGHDSWTTTMTADRGTTMADQPDGGTTGPWLQHSSEQGKESSPQTYATQYHITQPHTHTKIHTTIH